MPERPNNTLDTDTLRTALIQLADEYWHKACRLYPRALNGVQRPPLHFDLTGSSAGQVQFSRHGRRLRPQIIRLNLAVAQANPARHHQTVAHEIGHAVAVLVHGRAGSGHGQHWRTIMAAFGQPAERCHDYDLSGIPVRRQRRFRYACGCADDQWLTTVRHRRQQRGEQRYICRRCRTPLAFNDDDPNAGRR